MDTSQQHSTHNGGESDRYILMLNVLRPQVEAAEGALLEHYMRAPPLRLDGLNPGMLIVPEPAPGGGSSSSSSGGSGSSSGSSGGSGSGSSRRSSSSRRSRRNR